MSNPDFILSGATVDITAAAKDDPNPRVEILAYGGGLMRVANFGAVVIDLAKLKGSRVNLLADHNAKLDGIVGAGKAEVRDGKLYVTGNLAGNAPAARSIIDLHRAGVQFQASVGLEVLKRTFTRSATVNGQTINAERDFSLVTRGRLREVSITAIGADNTTSVAIAAGRKHAMDTENVTTSEIDPVVQAERSRVAAIVAEARRADHLPADKVATLQASAIDGGHTVEWLKSELLDLIRDSRPQARHVTYAGRGAQEQTAVLEAALSMTAGLTAHDLEKQGVDQRVLDAASSSRFNDFSIHDALFHTIRAANRTPSTHKVGPAVIREAFEAERQLQAAGYSTVSLPGLFGTVVNRTLLNSFNAAPTVWRTFAAQESNRDFRATKRYRLVTGGEFREVPPQGDIKHTTLIESDFDSTLATYGEMISLSRQDIINDDLGALTAIPRQLGRDAAVALEERVFTVLLGGIGSFFVAGNNNYLSGVTVGTNDSRLNLEGLERATAQFYSLVDDAGRPILVSPSVLLVPPSLLVAANSLTRDSEIRNTTANTVFTTGNPWSGQFTVSVSPYMSNATITGYSTTGWLLLAKNGDVAAAEVAFLNGKDTPTVEQGEMDFSQLGMSWRAYFDFGVSLRDPNAGVYSKGAA